MLIRTILLLISVSSFLAADYIPGGRNNIGMFVIKFFVLFVSFISFIALFIKTPGFQEILGEKLIKIFIIAILSIGSIYFLIAGFLFHGKDSSYVISTALDPISYFIQAKIFAAGHINVPSHELKDFFTTGYFINNGKYFSKYFPGWPLLLSIGVVSGLPWIINPILGILTLFVIYLIGKEIYDRTTGLFAAVLLIVSYNYYILTPEYMSEPSSLFFSSLFFYLMVKTQKEPKILLSSLAGLSLGILFLIRPFSAVAIALPVLVYFFFSSASNRRDKLISLTSVVLTFLPIFCIFLLYNYHQTGSIFLTPMEYYNPRDILGFGLRSRDVFMKAIYYSPFDALKNVSISLALLNWDAVLFLSVFIILVIINKKNKWDILLFAIVSLVVLLHIFYFVSDIRYYYASFFALFLLAGRGINLTSISYAKIFRGHTVKNLNNVILLFILTASIVIIISPHKLFSRNAAYGQLRDPFNIVEKNNLNNAVVFLKTVPEGYNNVTYYIQNPLDFDGKVLFAKDLKEKNIELMGYYSQKEFYYYDFDRKSRSGKLTKIR
jgi:hypothetical protein